MSWQRDGSSSENGLGLALGHVLAVGYWPADQSRERGLGTVIYRIDGGTLDGIWPPERAYDRTPGREVLSGSPDLLARRRIALGINPGGRSHYAGHADLERIGDRFGIAWHTSSQMFVGSGIKIGNVLAVANAASLRDRRLLRGRTASRRAPCSPPCPGRSVRDAGQRASERTAGACS